MAFDLIATGERLIAIRPRATDQQPDQETPEAAARAIAEAIPHCKATYYPDESHISLIANHAHEIVDALRPGP